MVLSGLFTGFICSIFLSSSVANIDTQVLSTYLKNYFKIQETLIEQQITSISSIEALSKISDKQVSIVMVGDVLLHDRIEKYSIDETGTYHYESLFQYVKQDISDADIAFVNEEVIIGGKELGISGYPAFNAPYELADELVKTGFDVILHGTNHALDKGKPGIVNALNYWKNNYPEIEVLGIHDSRESFSNITLIEKNNITLAILNYTYGTNGISVPSDMPYAVSYLTEDHIISDIDYAEANADFTIVCPHWGTEYSLESTKSQKKWANLMVEHGADLIIGTHPHVIEPIEWVTTENGNSALVYYSLGNFVNWTSGEGPGTSNRMLGGMAKITLQKQASSNKTTIKNYSMEPLVAHVTSTYQGITVYPLSQYSEELASQNEILKQDSEFSYRYCLDLYEKIMNNSNLYN